ncbi:MAG: fibrobacter succinogenes major paralogous domain-containing protein [Bacteroidales bacterium]|nr:fibrobacter succinogenes major paralogous domain-containing protein [Bacteroidales bacterium]
MKYVLVILFFLKANLFAQNYSTLEDSRDKKEYEIVLIGWKWWMAENLAYLPVVCSADNPDCSYWVYNYYGNDIEKAKETVFYKEYGCLYDYEAATNVCPQGWHLSTDEDWQSLINYIRKKKEGTIYSDISEKRIISVILNIKSIYGYKTLGGSFINAGFCSFFWTSTEADENHVFTRSFFSNKNKIQKTANQKFSGFSVRCVKD